MERRTTHILLVEENQRLVELMLRAFEPFADEFRVTIVHTLAEAQRSLVGMKPNLVFIGGGLSEGQQLFDIRVANFPVLFVLDHNSETDAVDVTKTEVFGSESALADLPNVARDALRQWEKRMDREDDDGALAEREEKIRQLETELAHLLRVNSMGEMAIVLAHELNQPLTAVATYAATCVELLARKQIDYEELRQALNQINRHVHHAGEITNRLNRFVSKSAHKKGSVDLNQLVDEACDLMANQIRLQQSEIKRDLEGVLPSVYVDAIQIRQVLVNLLQNAIEAMENVAPNERQIVVTTKKSSNGVQVAVCDHGQGILPEVRENLFEPYVTTKPNRLGMGLTISRRIIDAHGGTLISEAAQNRGAIFQFTLPTESSAMLPTESPD